jgi:pimeloyl-ACP methyl ester carboxylesterase
MTNNNIVMIHGMLGGSWYWKEYKDFFERKGYHCHTPTLRHHHYLFNSIPNPLLGTTSIADYLEDLEKEIRQLDSPPIIFGHSMGGILAQILGSRGLAKALVLIAPAAPHGILTLRFKVVKGFLSILSSWGFWNKPIRVTFQEFVYASAHLLPLEQQQAYYDRLVWESGRAATEVALPMLFRDPPTKVDESRVTCPVLVIAGSQDQIIPAPVARQIANKYHAVYKEFFNHAHWIISEPGWEIVADEIAQWLHYAVARQNV